MLAAFLVLPALAVGVAAVPRFFSGLALDASFPAADFIPQNAALPENVTYADAADALSGADARDGGAQILRAEAMQRAGEPPERFLPILAEGLAHHPASPRGWSLFAETEAAHEPERAAKALSLALRLAPLDYRIIFQRARAGAALWRLLDSEAQTILFRQTALLWSEEPLRREFLNDVLLLEGGPELIAQALADQPEELRALNRLTERRRMYGTGG
jgi:hypothetical protein